MSQSNLQARLYVGNQVEVVATGSEIKNLIVVLSSKLECETSGMSGDIIDTCRQQVVYRCCRSGY